MNSDPFLWAVLAHLRGVLFLGYQQPINPQDVAMRGRAKRILERVAAAAADAKQQSESLLRSGDLSDTERAPIEAMYIAGDQLLDHACNQLYFGSGAFRQSAEELSGIASGPEKQAFLDDYRDLLDQIGRHGSARTIHHLIQLYVFLAEASPADVFDRIASVLTVAAIAEDYQFEALGAEALVSLVRIYLADYRAIFEDPPRRAQLVAVLESFSSAGWPDALQLLYELPDLLR